MIFMKFVQSVPHPYIYYFVGQDLASVLADTEQGKGFGGAKLDSYSVITLIEAQSLELGLLDKGIKAVMAGCLSYLLQSPKSTLS